ncbi:hypothetical protein ACJRO7_029397 [Eucalyptus globulus]|uniref:NLE domain-containing protein n=1 Tax=Eucalyptus globulus TaxID=34317 RepID=A0ABD3K2Z6_EUCGL
MVTTTRGAPKMLKTVLTHAIHPIKSHLLVRPILAAEDKLPYTFYMEEQELVVPLESYLQKNKVSVEKVLSIVYQPQAIFRIHPVNCCSATIAGHSESVPFSPDGKQLAGGSGDTTVRLWDLKTQTPITIYSGHKKWVLSIAWSPDGKHLVSGSKAGELQCWDSLTGQPSGNPLVGHKKWITGISWEPVHLSSPCRRFVSSSKDGDARIWDVTLRRHVICLSSHTLMGRRRCNIFWAIDRTIKVWETSQGKLIRELKVHGHWVNSHALSTEYVALERYKKMKGNVPERLVSGADDFTIFCGNLLSLVNHVYFSSDGQWVASASFDKSVKLWNGITGKFVAAFEGHVGPLYQISWSVDSRLLLSGSKDAYTCRGVKKTRFDLTRTRKKLLALMEVGFNIMWFSKPNGKKEWKLALLWLIIEVAGLGFCKLSSCLVLCHDKKSSLFPLVCVA